MNLLNAALPNIDDPEREASAEDAQLIQECVCGIQLYTNLVDN